MLIEKEVIAPGQYWYSDEATGLPRKLDVTPDLTRYWLDQGNAMLGAGLTVPVPYEHDFSAHPMTPKDKLLNNAGWTKEYRVKDSPDPLTGRVRKDVLFSVLDIQDDEVAKKLPGTIRWTSPWINSFTDGSGKQWNNVISHIALTTRPRITRQAPFGSVAAALSMATPTKADTFAAAPITPTGFCLSRAGRLGTLKKAKRLVPRYPVAFSLFSGVAFGDGDMPPMAKKKNKPSSEGGKPDDNPTPSEDGDEFEAEAGNEEEGGGGGGPVGKPLPDNGGGDVDLPPLNDPAGDVGIEEVLCDLLSAMGIHCEHSGNEQQFKRSLYMAAMTKIHELTAKGMGNDMPKPGEIGKDQPKPPGAPGAPPNPLVQQEQQPMYMSLEEIQKINDPTMRTIALSMYNENVRLRGEVDANAKTANSLRDAKLKEANALRAQRVSMLGRLSPRAKPSIDAMLAQPGMALSMGDGGVVVDPMAQTLAVLEAGLADMPRLLTTDASALSVQPQPQDSDALTDERADEIAESMARMMGAPPLPRKTA